MWKKKGYEHKVYEFANDDNNDKNNNNNNNNNNNKILKNSQTSNL